MNYESIRCSTHRDDIEDVLTQNVCIFYNLENTLEVNVNGNVSFLRPNDVIVVNVNTSYTCKTNQGFYVMYELDENDLRSCFSSQKYSFICDSTKEIGQNYDRIRKILSEILIVLYTQHKYMNIKLNQLFYDLVLYLLRDFAIEQFDFKQSEKEILIDYVENHYFEELTLQEISDAFNMSSQYFSKYFKKHVGIQFLKYLTDVRLTHALKEVKNTKKRFILIAMDNGFPNVGAFNRFFREKYGITPKEYRDKFASAQSMNLGLLNDYSYAVKNLGIEPENDVKCVSIIVDSNQRSKYIPFWRKMINLGDSKLLDSAQIITQLKEVQKEIKFEYIRLFLDADSNVHGDKYNFVREEMRFNELYQMGFKIWISVDFRDIKDVDEYCRYLKSFLAFMTHQWSIHSIREWYFELTYNSNFVGDKPQKYIKYVEKIRNVLKLYGCEDNLVTAGLCFGNREGIRNYFKYLEQNQIRIKNQSFVVEPYLYYRDENGIEAVRATTENNTHNDLLTISQSYSYYKDVVENTFITSWRDNLQQFNLINDSCYKGALIIQNFLECFGNIDSISQCVALDAMYDPELKTGVLFGGNGLMNYHGIKKPSYYAYYFMSRNGNWYLDRNDNIIVFTNEDGNYHVIAHNCKKLGYRYFMEQDRLNVKYINDYFEDLDSIEVRICIKNVENGIYEIKKRSISNDGGSVQDELLNMTGEKSAFIHPHDISFLKSVSIPHLQLNEIAVTDNILDVKVILKANEFVNLHIIHQNY